MGAALFPRFADSGEALGAVSAPSRAVSRRVTVVSRHSRTVSLDTAAAALRGRDCGIADAVTAEVAARRVAARRGITRIPQSRPAGGRDCWEIGRWPRCRDGRDGREHGGYCGGGGGPESRRPRRPR